MVKNNQIPIEINKKPVEIVQEDFNESPLGVSKNSVELNENNWWQEKQFPIKKSSLSPSARSKVISKSGRNFQSEKEGYGPMDDDWGLSRDYANGMHYWAMLERERNQELREENDELRERLGDLKRRLSRTESELREVKTKYRYGEITNSWLREIIREQERKLRELEEENRKVSAESEERWRKIGRLERIIEELEEML